MLGEDLDATSASCRVGYGDTSHFTRDYEKLFGAPPARATPNGCGKAPGGVRSREPITDF
jgi:AraC-like DNA-binding protein